MPLYTWVSEEGREVRVVRKVDDRDVPPDKEECIAAGVEHTGPDMWRVRKVGDGIRTVRGRNWNGSKGNW